MMICRINDEVPIHRSALTQYGQAMAEAVVALMLLSVLLVCVISTSRMQYVWHGDLLNAHLNAQAVADGHMDQSSLIQGMGFIPHILKGLGVGQRQGRGLMRPMLQRFGAQRGTKLASNTHAADFDLTLEKAHLPHDGFMTGAINPLVDGGLEWLRVKTKTKFGNHAWQLRGQGSVSHTDETVGRIEQAQVLWQQPSHVSQRIVRRIAAMTDRVDQPWGRDAATTDWLSTWSDISELDPKGAGFIDRAIDTVLTVGQKIFGGVF